MRRHAYTAKISMESNARASGLGVTQLGLLHRHSELELPHAVERLDILSQLPVLSFSLLAFFFLRAQWLTLPLHLDDC